MLITYSTFSMVLNVTIVLCEEQLLFGISKMKPEVKVERGHHSKIKLVTQNIFMSSCQQIGFTEGTFFFTLNQY